MVIVLLFIVNYGNGIIIVNFGNGIVIVKNYGNGIVIVNYGNGIGSLQAKLVYDNMISRQNWGRNKS